MLYGTEEFNDLLIEIIQNGYRHPLYQECKDHAEEMSWHLYGVRPDKLLDMARPNEDEAIKTYRKENYQPTTKSAGDKAVNITSKIFNPNLYSIRWGKEKDNEQAQSLKSYTLEYYPEYNSLVNYTKDVLLRKMLADPNGIVCVKPGEMPEVQTETPMPEVYIYGSANLYDFDDEHYLIFERIEKVGKYDYHVFEYFDKDRYIEFYARVIKKTGLDYVLEILGEPYEEFAFTGLNEPPVWKLRGMSEAQDNGAIMFKSFFYSAVPFWNKAINHGSDLDGSMIRHMFPQKYELSEQCEFKYPYEGSSFPCKGGRITFGKASDPKAQIIECPHCKGSGWEPMGPYGVYRYVKEKLSENGGTIGIDPVGYINVPTDATKLLKEHVSDQMRAGMWAINMDVEDEVGAVQSGAAKTIDRSAQYDMLYNIGAIVFDVHLTNMFYYINKQMFSVESVSLGKTEDENLPEVNKPTQFDILTSAELLNNYKVSKDSGISQNILQLKEQEIISKDATTNPDLKKFALLLSDLDPLPGMGNDVVQSNVIAGYNSRAQAVIHFNLRAFVERAIRDTKNFVELEKDQKLVILEGYANEFIKKNKPVLEPAFNAAQ